MNSEIYVKKGDNAARLGQVSTARSCYRKALKVDPQRPDILYSLGGTHFVENDFEQALVWFQKAFSLSPQVDFARVIGASYSKLGEFHKAVSAYDYVLKNRPDDEDALRQSVICGRQLNDTLLVVRMSARLVNLFPKNHSYKATYIQSLSEGPTTLNEAYLIDAFVLSLQDERISCAAAADTWFRTIMTNADFLPLLQKIGTSNPEQIKEIMADKSAIQMLNSPFLSLGMTEINHPNGIFDRSFASIRNAILDYPEILDEITPFVLSMAKRLFINGFPLIEPNSKKVDRLLDRCDLSPEPDLRDLLVLACFRPLHLVRRLRREREDWETRKDIGTLVKLEVSNRLVEEAIRHEVDTFGQIRNRVSKANRQQYEEDPCPRWDTTHAPTLSEDLQKKTAGLHILNAGCGTGLEVINAAQSLKTSHFTAIDLSSASLSYAQRQTNEIGLSNISFFQGDILDLESLGRTFDLILSSGVLHHLDSPLAGLKKLAAVLSRSGGRMLIGLYSKIAREHLFDEIWSYIRNKGYQANPDDIRQFRQDVLDAPPDHVLKRAEEFRDFASVSECRDMFFHVKECRFTWLEVEELIDMAGLKLQRLLVPPSIKPLYLNDYPDDPDMTNLKNWDAFEVQNPETFKSMYYFWVAHKDDNTTLGTSPSVLASYLI